MKWLRKFKEPTTVVPNDPATEGQKASIAHNLSFTYEGMNAEEKADFAKALRIASPSGDPSDPASYSHLSKSQASAALDILIGF
jgi:hypothetical protein